MFDETIHAIHDDDDDDVVEAIGKASEALECVERARGHLYEFHQLMGHADFLFGDAVDLLRKAGLAADAERFDTEIVGHNVLDGRWSFQIVDEFDALYWEHLRSRVRQLELDHLGGRKHVFEATLKEQRRTAGRPGHEARPAATHAADGDPDPTPDGDPDLGR
ncbi:MAG: hypothetical protein U0Q22_08930 [Acidimicrobiales bacterium]